VQSDRKELTAFAMFSFNLSLLIKRRPEYGTIFIII